VSGTSPGTGGPFGAAQNAGRRRRPATSRPRRVSRLALLRPGVAPYSPKARICPHFQQLLILNPPAHIDNDLSIASRQAARRRGRRARGRRVGGVDRRAPTRRARMASNAQPANCPPVCFAAPSASALNRSAGVNRPSVGAGFACAATGAAVAATGTPAVRYPSLDRATAGRRWQQLLRDRRRLLRLPGAGPDGDPLLPVLRHGPRWLVTFLSRQVNPCQQERGRSRRRWR
jgi:hypothetical protein